MDVKVADISSVIGLIALVVLTFNFLLGLLLSTAYKRSVIWKKLPELVKSVNITEVHNKTAYFALALVFIHPILLVFDSSTKFHLIHIVIPFIAPHQKIWVALGVLSVYSLLVVIITTQKRIKEKMGFRAWKNIHLISYFTALLICLHGIFLDPELKDRMPDLLDGEKVVCEICFTILILCSFIRFRHYLKKQRG